MPRSRNVLVMGDWFVDENWIVTTESVSTSSHVGRVHYRSKITDPESQILTLCGAGSIASLFHGLATKIRTVSTNKKSATARSGGDRLEVYGLGIWEPEDTKIISALLDPAPLPVQTPLTVQGPHAGARGNRAPRRGCHQTPGCLECSNRPADCERMHTLGSARTGTWRVLRVYQRTGDRAPELLNRYDWEYDRDTINDDSMSQSLDAALTKWEGKHFDAIAVADHGKGCVSDALVRRMLRAAPFKKARWYVRAKDPRANWITLVRESGNLRLVLIGPKGIESTGEPWFLGTGLSEEAIKELTQYCDEDEGASRCPDVAVVAHHADNHLAAWIPQTNARLPNLFSSHTHPVPPRLRVGRTTMLFAALVASAEGLAGSGPKTLNARDLSDALARAHRWCCEIERILKEDTGRHDFRPHFGDALATSDAEHRARSAAIRFRQWHRHQETAAWENATSGQGTIPRLSKDEDQKIQLWRGWSAVPEFIALSPTRRQGIARLVKDVRSFVGHDRTPSQSYAAMLVAGPGWGKSFLVQQLAKQVGVASLEFNITHLATVADLIACFDAIASLQNQAGDKPLIVFWDEINAPLGSAYVYSYFLGPMWDGTYRRAGLTFRLRPAIWLFAGTSVPGEPNPTASGIPVPLHEAKASDFVSRLSGPPIDFRSAVPSERDRLEQMYTAVALIRRHHPDAKYVSEGLLKFLTDVHPRFGIRSVEFLVRRLRNVGQGVVRLGNLPVAEDVVPFVADDRAIVLKMLQAGDGKEVLVYDNPQEPDAFSDEGSTPQRP